MADVDAYPYPVHTNRELDLMLAGHKPLAAFVHERVDGFEKADALAGQDFEPHVRSGRLSEHLRTFPLDGPDRSVRVEYWFYTLPGEEWRVESYCLLVPLMLRGAWSAELEWLQGVLLGYTPEQNVFHLSRHYVEEVALRIAGTTSSSTPETPPPAPHRPV